MAPQQKKNKLSEPSGPSVPSLGKDSRENDSGVSQPETPSEEGREGVEKSNRLEHSGNEAEEVTTSDEQSSDARSKELQESEQSQKAEEENGYNRAHSGEEQDDRSPKDNDDEGVKPPISLPRTRGILGTGITTLQSLITGAHLVNKDPESTDNAIEARSEWSGENHSRYDTLERNYNQDGLETDDVEKLMSILKEDLALAEKIRIAIQDEKAAAARVWDFMMEIPEL